MVEMPVNNKDEELDQLRQYIENSAVASQLKSSATQLVFGSGNTDADVVFVGEAPGKQEDITGEPFVGASGKFLNEMLASAGMQRSDVYITNIVKYRPPKNRDPTKAEKEAFWPQLLNQIAVIRPKVIATLGRHSGEAFLPELIISKDHGQPQSIKVELGGREQTIIVLPLYHPAAALYNGKLRQTLLDDFQSIQKILADN